MVRTQRLGRLTTPELTLTEGQPILDRRDDRRGDVARDPTKASKERIIGQRENPRTDRTLPSDMTPGAKGIAAGPDTRAGGWIAQAIVGRRVSATKGNSTGRGTGKSKGASGIPVNGQESVAGRGESMDFVTT